jgi:ClpP class serine protease
VGSVGVITMHLDWTQRIKDDGLKVTIITYGSRKAEGSPLRELSDEALAAIQQDINTMGELFVNTVARNRGLAQRL